MEDAVEDAELITASLRVPIPDSNKGYQMLKLMGWAGQGLGRQGQGEAAPLLLWASSRVCRQCLPEWFTESQVVHRESRRVEESPLWRRQPACVYSMEFWGLKPYPDF